MRWLKIVKEPNNPIESKHSTYKNLFKVGYTDIMHNIIYCYKTCYLTNNPLESFIYFKERFKE